MRGIEWRCRTSVVHRGRGSIVGSLIDVPVCGQTGRDGHMTRPYPPQLAATRAVPHMQPGGGIGRDQLNPAVAIDVGRRDPHDWPPSRKIEE